MRLVPAAARARVRPASRPAAAQVYDGARRSLASPSPARGGAGSVGKRRERIGAVGHAVEHALRRRRPDAGQELQHAEAGDAVARVLDEAQQRQHVLDVRGVEELQPAELDERNVAAGQLDLERAAVVRGAEQHRLLLQRASRLAVLQHALDDVARLVGFVAHGDELRPLADVAVGPEVLGEALARQDRSPHWRRRGSAASSGSCGRA